MRCQRLAQQMLISWRKQQQHWFKKIKKREKKCKFCGWWESVSEVLVMAKMTCNGTKKNLLFNLLSPMSNQDRISPYNIITISSRQLMRIKKNIDYIIRGLIISWSKTKFSKLTSQELLMADRKENYQWDHGS